MSEGAGVREKRTDEALPGRTDNGARVKRIGMGAATAVILFLIGLAPRLWQLTYHSLWLDEAISIGWARLPAGRILAVGLALVQDKHPPLYYLLLHYWIGWFGAGETSVRVLSALVGALAVPLGYGLLRDLAGPRAAWAGALLLAVNPFLVWYGQEVRMFGLATTLLLGAGWCLVRAVRGGRWAAWAGYVLLSMASFYTYLFSALALAAFGVYAAATLALRGWARRRERPGREGSPPAAARLRWAVPLTVLVVGCAPLAWQAWRVGTGEATRGAPFSTLPAQGATLLRAFTVWKAPWSGTAVDVAMVLLALAALWGAVVSLGKTPHRGGAELPFLAVFLAVPWLIGNALLWADRTVFDEARYLIFLAPAFALALARPLGARRPSVRALGALACLLALGTFVAALGFDWTPAARREEWRAAARYVETHAGPQDVILVHADYTAQAFLYYYHGAARVIYPFTGAIESAEQVTPELSTLARAPAVWLVRSHGEVPDPQGILESWFADRYPLITEQYPAGIRLKGYATGYRTAEAPAGAAMPPPATFDGGALRLAGSRIDGPVVAARDDLFHPPSGWVHATLYWQALRLLTTAYTPRVMVTDAQGQIWGDRLDRPNGAMKVYPPERWQVGETVRDDYDVNLNPVTPPGRYRVELGLGGEKAVLGEIEVR